MRVKGITRRWLINGVGLILILLIGIEVAAAIAVRGWYYTRVEQELTNQAESLENFFSRYYLTDNRDLEKAAKEFVEDFDNRDQMELMMLDRYGNVLVTSTGFEPDITQEMPDYNNALENDDHFSLWKGKLNSGENVAAVTRIILGQDSSNGGAVRLVVSLEEVDNRILVVVVCFLAVGVAIIFFVIISGSYFIGTIVNPIQEVGKIAKRIAQGDFKARIQKAKDDEIGELCDTINYMAQELGAAERMKNDFISSVSHELRTPLTAVKGWADTMATGDLEQDKETLEKGIQVISREAERLSGIVEELLDFSRMQSGRLTLMMDRIDLLAELSEAVYMFKDRASREGITLEYEEPEVMLPVLGDKDRLKQMFVNIIENAIKYSKPGGLVRVEASEWEGMVRTVVADNGCGIAAADLPRVKEKFYKANNTRSGSGIGLAVVDEIVRLHNGKLTIESTEGVGTTVIIEIPVMQKKAETVIVDVSEPVGQAEKQRGDDER